MSRRRKRARLDSGLSFDVNVLVRAGISGECKQCLLSFAGEEIPAEVRIDPRGAGQLTIRFPEREQTIEMTAVRYWRSRRMAYGSQFLAPHKRAEVGIKRIETKLGTKDDEDTLWKPKWQRWRTFNRYCARLDKYDEIIEAREQELNVRLVRTLHRLKMRG
jgi:hypothetical protein